MIMYELSAAIPGKEFVFFNVYSKSQHFYMLADKGSLENIGLKTSVRKFEVKED